jgi:hypothetical protein
MKINNEKRRKLWDDYCKAEFILKNLKSIVQNEGEIIDEELGNHYGMTQDLIGMINDLHDEVVNSCN